MSAADLIAARIARIVTKLRARGIRLVECLSEEATTSFERRCGISLPEGYRTFLRTVGNGGPGPPAYGWAGLGEAGGQTSDEQLRVWSELHRVNKPFPFTQAWVWEDGDASSEGSREQVQNGSIYLGNDGCGQYWFLVVSGPERGNVWLLADVGVTPTLPKRDFLQWYEDWLDGVENWWA
jgi:hypothetical protein